MTVTGWQVVKLRDIASKVGSGATPRGGQESYHRSGTPLIRSLNVHFDGFREDGLAYLSPEQAAELNNATVRARDVLLNITGASIGRVTVAPEHMAGARVNQHVCVIRSVEGVNSSFLRWFLASPSQQAVIFAVEVGATRQALTKQMILDFDVPIPPEHEQDRIVAKIEELLSDLDAGVSALERARANLKKYRAAVLKSAVTGELTAEWRAAHPHVEPANKLLDRVLAEQRRKWEADQQAKFATNGKTPPKDWRDKYAAPKPPDTTLLPELPKGWCWATVVQVGNVQLGRQRSPKHHKGPHMRPYLRVANVFEDRIDTSDVMEMNFSPEEFNTYSLAFGDILLNEGQSMELVGRPAMYRDEMPGACFTNTLVRFRANDGIDPRFALRVFLAYLKNGRFQEVATITVNIAHLGAGRFAEIEFPVPPLEEQAAIIEELDRHFSMLEAAERAVNTSLIRASSLRKSILKEAFSGRLVPQDSADEPASVLLDRIRGARAKSRSE
jgi:type I restriction enzyme S subunit